MTKTYTIEYDHIGGDHRILTSPNIWYFSQLLDSVLENSEVISSTIKIFTEEIES